MELNFKWECDHMTYRVEVLQEADLLWFSEVAAVNMLTYELQRPELICLPQIYTLALKGMESKTAFVVKQDDEPVGALGGILVPNLFNPELTTLAEIFWYVPPEYRNTRVGGMLLLELERAGEELADEITLSLLPSSTIKMETLEKRGFKLSEFGFRKQIGE